MKDKVLTMKAYICTWRTMKDKVWSIKDKV